jgi:hypothetical protein
MLLKRDLKFFVEVFVMKKNLFILSCTCVLLSSCETNQPTAPQQQTTPSMDKTQDEKSVGVVQELRQRLMGDDSLSSSAKTIEITEINGVVTLSGKVDSEEEKNKIAAHAKSVNGIKNVDDQLDIVVLEEEVPSSEQTDDEQN